jgi:DNA-binding transcriptional ArsR family regulator
MADQREALRELPIAQPPLVAQPRVVAHPRNITLEVFRALGHPLRLELVAQVAARGPICVCHLHEMLPYSQPQISKHLAVLREAGLLQSRREGSWVYYTANEDALDIAREFLEGLEASMHRPHLADSCEEETAG